MKGEQQGQIFKLPEAGEAPESIDVRRLPHLISGVGLSKGADRIAVALQINRVLRAMRGPGHEAAESGILIAALDAHRLDGLVDAHGRSCRKEAVETLLACGFPHALQVSPEDLAFARQYQPPLVESEGDDGRPSPEWESQLQAQRKRGLYVILGGQGLFGLLSLYTPPSAGVTAGVAVAAGLAAVMTSLGFARRPHLENQAVVGSVLGMLALSQAACALELGAPALLGAVGIVAGLLVSLASQYQPRADRPKPGDWDYKDR